MTSQLLQRQQISLEGDDLDDRTWNRPLHDMDRPADIGPQSESDIDDANRAALASGLDEATWEYESVQRFQVRTAEGVVVLPHLLMKSSR